jgi:ADP-ribosylation factor-like protein 3
MGLLDLLRKLKRSDREAKILILGLDNAGKTTMLKYISSENPKDTTTTKGFNVKTIIKDSKKLNVWDIGGQKEIRQYWENYYDNVDGLIFVVDSSDDYRIKECNEEFKLLISVNNFLKFYRTLN